VSTAAFAPPLAADEFAQIDGLAYLNHAAAGVLPRRTRDALLALINGQAERGVLGFLSAEAALPAIRERIRRFVGGSGNGVALLRNTGDGANVVARGLDWQQGDEIVLCDNEFGANAMPWLALRELGVVVRFIRTPHERMTPDVLRRELSSRTRVVAVSWVSFFDGYRHDLAALSELAHGAGAWFCVDAIQGLGAFPLDAGALGIDALYAGGAKWLLALPGASFLYLAPRLFERLVPRWRGWRDVANIWDFLDYDQPFAPDGSRFEGGTPNFHGSVAMSNSMDVIEAGGLERIAAHVLALTDHLVDGLHALGAEIATVRGPGVSSGIVTFALPGIDSVELGRRLGKANIVTTFRPTGVRVSPHGHNSIADIDRLLEELRAQAGR
jgi:selenocysteine lyase/cysteine desulfurase